MPVVQMLGIIYYLPKKQDTVYTRRTHMFTYIHVYHYMPKKQTHHKYMHWAKAPCPKYYDGLTTLKLTT